MPVSQPEILSLWVGEQWARAGLRHIRKGERRMPKETAAKKTTFGADLIAGMKLVLAHQRGKIELEQVWPKPIDVKAPRKRTK